MEENIDEYHGFLRFYISGNLPSLGALHRILGLFETSVIWSVLTWMNNKKNDYRDLYYKSGRTKVEEKIVQDGKTIEEKLDLLDKSYAEYLENKYRPFVNYVMSETGAPFVPSFSSDGKYIYSTSFQDRWAWFDDFIKKQCIGASELEYIDFSEWYSAELGIDIIKTNNISTSNSIEIIVDYGALISILALQQYPDIKEAIVYSLGIIKQWISKHKEIKKTDFHIPKLPPIYKKLIEQYDEVNIELKSDSYKISLKRR